jgi:hypothetical protein
LKLQESAYKSISFALSFFITHVWNANFKLIE